MARRQHYHPLRVLLNNQLVGSLQKESGGGIHFQYGEAWLHKKNAIPVSLSLPLREEVFRGEPVVAVFENLLPDSEALRRKIAGKVGAKGTDAYSLLHSIGRDCVGALQFVPDTDETEYDSSHITGEPLEEAAIEEMLLNLTQAPLGLNQEDSFRISVAGAQEKTALLRHDGQWLKPSGPTPTSHIFKTAMGHLPNGIDLSHSVENEYYCVKLLEAFELPVCQVEIHRFGNTSALVVERFDRLLTADGRLLRLPQEDCCQALSVLPNQKYQNEGGPGMTEIMNLLKGSDTPEADLRTFLKAQILFWLIAGTDGHAKNFSIFLRPGGSFKLTPLYDVLSAQPSLHRHQITKQQLKLAMSVRKNRHYRLDVIRGRHFIQTAEKAGIPGTFAREALDEIGSLAPVAMKRLEETNPSGTISELHEIVRHGIESRLGWLQE